MLAPLFKSCQSVLFVLTCSALAHAQSPSPSPTLNSETAVLWYRSSDGCPDGPGFLARIGERASLIRLAHAGDRVDFMVTLAASPGGAHGRLERETERGTVAIREIEDTSCDSVADVVALNLSLALDPDAQAQPGDDAPQGTTAPPEVQDASIPKSSEPESTQSSALGSQSDHTPTDKQRLVVRLGAQGGVLTGVASQVMGRAIAFVELGEIVKWGAVDLTLRAAAVGAWGASNTTSGTIRQTVWAGRFDVCPVVLGSATLSARPCAALELGQLRASGPLSDTALWAALAAHVRGQWVVIGPLAVEAELGANFPLRRYEIAAGASELYRSAVVGLSTSLGASVAF